MTYRGVPKKCGKQEKAKNLQSQLKEYTFEFQGYSIDDM